MIVDVDNTINKTKAKIDEKLYRMVTLDNGLQAMLISTVNETETFGPDLASRLDDRHISARHSNMFTLNPSAAADFFVKNSFALDMDDVVDPDVTEEEHISHLPIPRKITRARTNKHLSNLSANFSHLSASLNGPSQRGFHRKTVSIRGSARYSSRLHNMNGLKRLSLLSGLRSISFQPEDLQSALQRSATQLSNAKPMPIIEATEAMVQNTNQVAVKMAYVSLCVGVGSYAEPSEFNGLAHFLEHMLFMGSKEYPEENSFDKLVSKVGGSSNAYTDSERTVYYFSCPQNYLADVLDRFAHFFIDALLLPERGSREISTIEEEFKMRKNLDNVRLIELWRYTSREESPYSRFTCGNQKTLNTSLLDYEDGVPIIYKELRKFYEKYYVGENMRLVIQCDEHLDGIQQLVDKFFQKVRTVPSEEKPGRVDLDFSHTGVAWRIGNPKLARTVQEAHSGEIWEEIVRSDVRKINDGILEPGEDGASLGSIFRILPLQDVNDINLTWQIRPQSQVRRENFGDKPTSSLEYISILLGYDCRNSLSYELKRKGYIKELFVTSHNMEGNEDNTMFTLFILQITLTHLGVAHWVTVVALVFQYIGMLVRSGPQKWFSDEIAESLKLDFQYQENSNPLERVQILSTQMLPQWGYTSEQYLDCGRRNGLTWDPEDIRKLLQQLNPYLVRIDLMCCDFQNMKRKSETSSTSASIGKANSRRFKFRRKKTKVATQEANYFDRESWTLEEVNSCEDFHVLYDFPEGEIKVEPITEVQYMVDRIPPNIAKLWQNCYYFRTYITWRDMNMQFIERKSKAYGKNIRDLQQLENKRGRGLSYRSLKVMPGSDFGSVTETLLSFSFPPPNKYLARNTRVKEHICTTVDAPLLSLIGAKLLLSDFKIAIPQGVPLVDSMKSEYDKADRSFVDAEIVLISESQKRILLKYSKSKGIQRWFSYSDKFISTLLVKKKEVNIPDVVFGCSVDNEQCLEMLFHTTSKLQTAPSKAHSEKADFQRSEKSFLKSSSVRYPRAHYSLGNDETPSSGTIAAHKELCTDFPGLPSGRKHPLDVPVQVLGSNTLISAWHLQDKEYKMPRGSIYLKISSAVASESVGLAAANDLFCYLIGESLREAIYMAEFAGIVLNILPHEHGHAIQINGLANHIPDLLNDVLSFYMKFALMGIAVYGRAEKNNNQGRNFKKTLRRKQTRIQAKIATDVLASFHKILPLPLYDAQVEALQSLYETEGAFVDNSVPFSYALYKLLVEGTFSAEEKSEELRTLDPTQLIKYAASFLQSSRVEMFITGNFSVLDSEQILRGVNAQFDKLGETHLSQAFDFHALKRPTLRKIPRSKTVSNNNRWHALTGQLCVLEAVHFPNHSLDLYFHIGPCTSRSVVLADILEQLIAEPLFRKLRTIQQLTYSVKCSSVKLQNEHGFHIELNSGKYDVPRLAEMIDEFLLEFRDILDCMPLEDLFSHISSIARKKIEQKQSHSKKVDFYWKILSEAAFDPSQSFKFNRLEEDVQFMQNYVTKDLLLASYDEWLYPLSQKRRKLSLVVFGHGQGERSIGDLKDQDFITIIHSSNEKDDVRKHELRKIPRWPCAIM
eukprot:snap_masked-scaffold_16-processed-gene-0.20-mRNA-1 protein AED:0.19 eAED:0.23 QI:0/-1/0/1/-1/1/1/0/1581